MSSLATKIGYYNASRYNKDKINQVLGMLAKVWFGSSSNVQFVDIDGVETNPHQTLIRLKNNIVLLSRPKVGFNAGY